jgi:hypothetical protein
LVFIPSGGVFRSLLEILAGFQSQNQGIWILFEGIESHFKAFGDTFVRLIYIRNDFGIYIVTYIVTIIFVNC